VDGVFCHGTSIAVRPFRFRFDATPIASVSSMTSWSDWTSNASDMILDEQSVRDLGRFTEAISRSFDDQRLDLMRRDPVEVRACLGPPCRRAEEI